MTNQQREKITELRGQGLGYTAIANAVGLSKDSVKAYCRSHHLGKNTDHSADYSPAQLCLHCGKELVHTPGKKGEEILLPGMQTGMVEFTSTGGQEKIGLFLHLPSLRQAFHRLRQQPSKILLS